MATGTQRPKLIAVVGPTASGKSDLAMRIAEQFNGEIICADSRTVYKGMDIGTAKPSKVDQATIKHWGLNLLNPGDRFTVASFKDYAQLKISDINKRGMLPILVGGSGLYVDSVIFDYKFGGDANSENRAELEKLSVQDLQTSIKLNNLPLPTNPKNKRHLIRVIETGDIRVSDYTKAKKSVVILGIKPSDNELKARIQRRAKLMFKHGVVEETNSLMKKYGQQAMNSSGGIVYRICQRVLNQEISVEEAEDLFITADWQYARRQVTWFKRNHQIVWFGSTEEAFLFVESLLNT